MVKKQVSAKMSSKLKLTKPATTRANAANFSVNLMLKQGLAKNVVRIENQDVMGQCIRIPAADINRPLASGSL